MVPSWADQLLPQLLIEQFDTLPIQCRHIEHMHEGVWFRKESPQTLFVVGILFSLCLSVRQSVTFCFLNNSKSLCWIFIKPCKHVHKCKTNTLDKKVRANGQFY